MEIVCRRRSNCQKEPWFGKSSCFACLMTYFLWSCSGAIKSSVPRCICSVPVFLFDKLVTWFRSSHQRCFIKKGILKNFAKFIGKHLCQSLYFNKVIGLRPIFKNTFFTKHLRPTASVDSQKSGSLYCNELFFYGHMLSSVVSVIFP